MDISKHLFAVRDNAIRLCEKASKAENDEWWTRAVRLRAIDFSQLNVRKGKFSTAAADVVWLHEQGIRDPAQATSFLQSNPIEGWARLSIGALGFAIQTAISVKNKEKMKGSPAILESVVLGHLMDCQAVAERLARDE